MRLKISKSLEFFLKKNFLPQSYLVKKRLERSIKKRDENEIELVKKFINDNTDALRVVSAYTSGGSPVHGSNLLLYHQIYLLLIVFGHLQIGLG